MPQSFQTSQTTKPQPLKAKPGKKWDETMYVQVYILARTGLSDTKIAAALGVSTSCFSNWLIKRPALQDAIRRARKEDGGTFRDYCYQRLKPVAKEAWDRLCLLDQVGNEDLNPSDIVQGLSAPYKQQLFIYALVHCNFNPSVACRKTGTPSEALRGWMKDPEFAEVIKEMEWHKANFFEEALVQKIKEGDSNAIIFANRTFNRDRGYGDKVEVEHKGSVSHTHLVSQVNLDELDLSLECRREILQAIRKKNEGRKVIEHMEVPPIVRKPDQISVKEKING